MRFFGEWKCESEKASYEAFLLDFDLTRAQAPAKRDIIFACYSHGGYEGSAIVIYREGGQIFEVESGHCSCNGLDWGVGGKTTPDALARRDVPYACEDKESREAWSRLVKRLVRQAETVRA